MKRKAIWVTTSLEQLNEYLDNGWSVYRVDKQKQENNKEYLIYILELKTIKDERKEKLEEIDANNN